MARVTLAKASLQELKEEVKRRQAALPALIAQRDELDRKIAELQSLGEVASASKAPERPAPRATRAMVKRRKGHKTLKSVLVEILQEKPGMSVAEIAEAALAAGYKSKSKVFKTLVKQALYHDKTFRRVGKGRFAMRG